MASATGATPAPGTRLVFANQLRGVAACAVLLAHYTVVVQTLRPAVSWVVGAPPLEGPVPAVARWVAAAPVDIGATAVAVFFLISGFVVPFSLAGLGSARFLLARAWRILPTFWAALALGGLAVAASGHFWGHGVPYGWRDYAVNGSLLESWVGKQTVDWVSWTLSVEAKFYLLAALFRPLLLGCPVRLAIAWAALVLAVAAGVRAGWLVVSPEFFSEATFLPFMLVGTLFHAHLTQRLRTAGLVGGAAAVLGLVLACWRFGPSAAETAARGWSLLVGLAIFAAAYAWRERFRANRFLDAAAAISYPLYLIHSLLGFSLLSFLVLAWQVPYGLAAPLTLVVVACVAAGLHRAVELPTTRLGHHLARWRPARRATA